MKCHSSTKVFSFFWCKSSTRFLGMWNISSKWVNITSCKSPLMVYCSSLKKETLNFLPTIQINLLFFRYVKISPSKIISKKKKSPLKHYFQSFLLFNFFSFWNAKVGTCTLRYFGVDINWQLTRFVVYATNFQSHKWKHLMEAFLSKKLFQIKNSDTNNFKGIVRSFHQENRKNFFFVIAIYQA